MKKKDELIVAAILDIEDAIPVLSQEQLLIVAQNYDKMDIADLTRLVFGDKSLDGRTNKAKAIKIWLASQSKTIKTTKKEIKGDFILTEQHKTFINMNASDMRPLEMTRILFDDPTLTLVSGPGRAVYKYSQELSKSNVDFWDEPVERKEYIPPRSVQHVLGVANNYVANQLEPAKEAYAFSNLRPYELKCLKALLGYLKTVRFRYQASSYEKKADRTLFESSFVRTVHDKADLSAADVDMYVMAAAEMVNVTREERKILRLEEQLDQILSGEGDDKQRLSQAFVELLNQTRTKWDASKARYKGFIESLESTRAKRDEHKVKQNQSVLNLLEAWQKDEETRNDILAFGDREKAEDRDEVQRLTQFDGVIALIAGHTKDEAGNG